MPIYSKYTGVGGGTTYTFVGVAPVSVTDVAGTVTTSMTQANSMTDGWLSSSDWSTFNSKQNALTFGNLTETVSSVLTITGGTGAVIGSGTTIQMSQSGVATSGYLSSTDWNTFNNKQPAGNYITALTGEVTATGPGSATATIANQSGNADKVLATNGTAVTWQYAGLGSGFSGGNVILGRGKPTNLTGASSVIISPGAGDALTSGTKNIICGEYAAGNLSTGQQNLVIGYGAAYSSGFAYLTTGNYCVVLGSSASTAATNTSDCVSIGYSAVAALNGISIGTTAGRYNTGSSNVAVGYGALKGASGTSTGDLNCALGYNSGTAILSGFANTLIGYTAGNTITDGVGNTLIGYNCQAASATTNNAFVLGSNSTAGAASIAMGSSVTGGPSCVTIGQSSTSSGSTGSIVLGHSSSAVNLSNVCSIGSTVQNITTTYLGLGAEQILAAGDFKAIKLMTARAASGGGLTNLDASAGTLTIAGSQGSGTGVGGVVYLATAPAGSSGNTLNAHVNRLEIEAANAGNVKVLTGQLTVETVGKGISIKEGTNAKMGITGAFPGTNPNTVTVSTTAVTANSRIFLTAQSNPGGHQPDFYISTVTANTSFVITSHDNNFNGTVAWIIFEPA